MSESKHSSTLPSKSSSVVTIHVQDAKGYTRYSGVPEHALELCKENNSGAAGVAAKSIAGTLPSNVPGMHGLIQAAHEAFADELPLHLRPDDLYLAIVQQVAIQVASNPDKYRAKVGIQKPEGKEVIRVRHDGLSTADSIAKATPKWATVFPVFAEEINKRIKATDVTKAVQLQFSTTSSQDVLVRQIAFMDVLKSYFDYRVCTRCGITDVHLHGTQDDWKALMATLDVFERDLDLGWYTAPLKAILPHFVDAFDGTKKPDLKFWRSLYHYESWSGRETADGWLLAFVPTKGAQSYTDKSKWAEYEFVRGVYNPSDYGTGLCSVPFIWEYLGQTLPMSFAAGFASRFDDGQLHVDTVWAVAKADDDDKGKKEEESKA